MTADGMAARWIGQRMPRLEDQRMITGHGRYLDDLYRAGMAHAAFVRSTVARGQITGLDVTAARRAAGVIAVFTAAEINTPARTCPGAHGPTVRRGGCWPTATYGT